MGVFVKICGVASHADVAAVCALGPDALGFNFWPRSSRFVQAEDVAEWTRGLGEVLKVGVFVDSAREEIERIVETAGLDVIQLHGTEAPELCGGWGLKTWRVMHLTDGWEERIRSYRVDAFLVDSYSTQSPGGTGKVCDWEVARACVELTETPVLLAGGLTPDNVEEAIEKVQPWGVDVCSGVEREPGRKDLAKVEEFIRRCRND